MPLKKFATLLPVLALACFVAGCGSGSKTEVLPVDPASAVDEATYADESYGSSTDESAN